MVNSNRLAELITGETVLQQSTGNCNALAVYEFLKGKLAVLDLYRSIREWLESNSEQDLQYVMYRAGYRDATEPINELMELLETPVKEWFFKNNRDHTVNFLKHIINEMEITDVKALCEMNTLVARLNAKLVIWIDTGFDITKRTAPLFAMARCEQFRRIRLPKDLFEKVVTEGLDSILPELRILIVDHYQQNGGVLKMWGQIKTYILYDAASSTVKHGVKFNPDGTDAADDVVIHFSCPK